MIHMKIACVCHKKTLTTISSEHIFVIHFHFDSIEFPPSIFQDRFFAANRPQYMNYASIGSIIGHEITHGFDDEGRQYDLDGNLFNWWNPETERQFLNKAKCIIEQYSNYTDVRTNLTVN